MKHRRGRALRRRYGHSGPPDPAGEWAVVQRMMQAYAEHSGLEYVWNSALPTGRVVNGDGVWSFYARPRGGGKATQRTVGNAELRRVYARRGAS